MRKNDKLKNFTNYKMDSDVYKLRRKVINLIYELKNEGLILPRIDVRIGENKNCNVLGTAKLHGNIIWINKVISKNKCLQIFKNYYKKYNNIKQMEVA
jgi:hypothetical protein